jgi:putative oxidoreductase
MRIAVIIARTFLGLVFFVFGLVTLFNLMPMQMPKGDAGTFMTVMFSSHYIYAVKCFEVAGGLILLTGRFTPLGLTLVGPVIVNILFYDIFLDRTGLPMGIVIAVLALFLLWQKRSAFAGLVRN